MTIMRRMMMIEIMIIMIIMIIIIVIIIIIICRMTLERMKLVVPFMIPRISVMLSPR